MQPSGEPGRWNASGELRRGDSYKAEVYVPTPTAGELQAADSTGLHTPREEDLELTVPFLPRRRPTIRSSAASSAAGSTTPSCTCGRSATTASRS